MTAFPQTPTPFPAPVRAFRVDLLGAAVSGQPVEDRGDRLGLLGASDPGAVLSAGGSAIGHAHISHGSSQREDRVMAERLRDATSPYLLQHADNPVDWWQWGEEAFAEARRRDVPVLLSVGYSACHWCHVMAHESFEDPATAQLVNDLVVPVKVDREERPDVDAVYMTATQAMTGQR